MKVVVCTNLYPVGGRQDAMGVTAAIRDLIHEIKGEVDFTILRIRSFLNRSRYAPPRSYIDEGLNVHDYSIFPFASAHARCLTRLLNKKHYISLEESDAIVCHMADQAYEMLKLFPEFRSKLIYTMHSNDILQKKFMEYALNHSARVLTRSEHLKTYLESSYNSKVHGVVFSGIDNIDSDSDSDSVSVSVSESDIPFRCNKILYAGALIKRKNVDLIIEASKLIKEDCSHLEVLVVGDGPELNYLKSISPNYVKFLGSLPHTQVLSLMKKSDIFIMPSVRETLGLVYLEAMRQECIVIGTKGEGIDGIIIDGKNGYLIDTLTPEGVRNKLLLAINTGGEMTKNAYKTSLGFSKDLAASNYKKLINLKII